MPKFLLSIAVFLLSVNAWADSCSSSPHTTHSISTNKSVTCTLAKLHEADKFCLVDAQGNEIGGKTFTVDPGVNGFFGMELGEGVDFNMEYALTCVANDGMPIRSPKIVFVIGVIRQGVPNIKVNKFYGAKGTWTSNGTGEDYSLTFK